MSRQSRGLAAESHTHYYREGGFKVDILRSRARRLGGPVVTLQGGLTDNLSRSMRNLAPALVEASDGELTVATVSTLRPNNPVGLVLGSFRPRTHRSKANAGAAKYMSRVYRPDALIIAGQSEGGVSAVDAAGHIVSRPHKRGVTVEGVVTMDTPGVFEELNYDGHIVEGLAKLMMNCMQDFEGVNRTKQMIEAIPHLANLGMPLELAYVTNEVQYLKDIHIDEEIAGLRRAGVDVRHIFHMDDVVPGAESDSPHVSAFPGGHMRFAVEPEPVAACISDFAAELVDRRSRLSGYGDLPLAA